MGNPGANADGSALVTPSARNLPNFTWPINEGGEPNCICTSPAIRAVIDNEVLL